MSDLRKLIDAVEKGDIEGADDPAYTFTILRPGIRGSARAAYNGSLDAAKALHDAMLTGWEWQKSGGEITVFKIYPYQSMESSRIKGNPARAWLLAILRAYEAQQ